MPSYGRQPDDNEVASVLTYVRNAWGRRRTRSPPVRFSTRARRSRRSDWPALTTQFVESWPSMRLAYDILQETINRVYPASRRSSPAMNAPARTAIGNSGRFEP